MNTTRRSFFTRLAGAAAALGLSLPRLQAENLTSLASFDDKPVPTYEFNPPDPRDVLPEFEMLPERKPAEKVGLSNFLSEDFSRGGFADHGGSYHEPVNLFWIGMEFNWLGKSPNGFPKPERAWLDVHLRYSDSPEEVAEKLEQFAARIRTRQFGAYGNEIRTGTGVNDDALFVVEAMRQLEAKTHKFA